MEKKKLNNEGFSLIELIIVIAIMAILVGALAPQFMKYLERSRVSSDTQLADSVKVAFEVALSDEKVKAPSSITPAASLNDITTTNGYDTTFVSALTTSLGVTNLSEVAGKLQSSPVDNDKDNMDIQVEYKNFHVTVTITDSNSQPGTDPAVPIKVE